MAGSRLNLTGDKDLREIAFALGTATGPPWHLMETPPEARLSAAMILDARVHPRILVELARVTGEGLVGRKLLVCPRLGEGRELLHPLPLVDKAIDAVVARGGVAS